MSVNSKMTAIADAIRSKTGGTDKLSLEGMATAIAGIETGGGSGGSVLVDETVTLANALTATKTTVYQSENLKNLSWYLVLFVKLNPTLASGSYETVQVSQNKNYQCQMIRWTGSGYSGNHYTGNNITIDESGAVKISTSNASTLPILPGDYRLIVIV